MTNRSVRRMFRGFMTIVAVAGSCAVSAQTIQTLDRTIIFGKTNVLQAEFGDPARAFDFALLNVQPVTGFTACQITATRGLYCLDGREVRNWPDLELANGTGTLVMSCADTALDLDLRTPETCTAMTVDQAGAIWLAGKKGNAYNLIKVFRKPGSANCPGPTVETVQLAQAPTLCARTFVFGRPLVPDIVSVDGDVGARFPLGAGTLGIEGKTVVFYDDTAGVAPRLVADFKDLLVNSEQETLLTTTVLQLTVGTSLKSYALASTSSGRIYAVDAAATTPAPFQVFSAPTERAGTSPPTVPAVQCTTTGQRYAIRASSKSGRVYLTDRSFCQALSLQASVSGGAFTLVNTQENGEDLTFVTTAGTTSYLIDGPSVAPGIIVDLSKCVGQCTLLSDANGASAARLSKVSLVGPTTDMVLFQVKNGLDCRQIPVADRPPVCLQTGVILDRNGNPSAGVYDPANQYLNVTAMLPAEITVLFDASGVPPTGLPPMLIPPAFKAAKSYQVSQGQYAVKDEPYYFDLFFGIGAAGLQFNSVFEGEFDVAKLSGVQLGCGFEYSEAAKPNRLFDVTLTGSERFVTVGGPNGATNRHIGTFVNSGCFNPTKVSGTRWSWYAYNLQFTETTDGVFADQLVSLYNDLNTMVREHACKRVDALSGAAPLSAAACKTLNSAWNSGKDKLNKCISASAFPKQSEAVRNCNSFDSQMTNYLSTARGITATGPDPANRAREVEARALVIQTFLRERFVPSVPLQGFRYLPTTQPY
jgi:hypothetical protein